MNSLDRDLQKGDHVLVNGHDFICDGGGFGAMSFTMGTALGGHFVGEEEFSKVDSMSIDKEDTLERFSEQNGWINRFIGIEITDD